MSYKIPKIFSFLSSITSVFIVGLFLIQEYYNESYKGLTQSEELYSSLVVYSEVNLLACLLYITLSCLWSGVILCCNDKDESICQFSILKTLFLFSGIGTNIYLFILLIKNSEIINKKLTIAGWILISNLFFIILVTSINKIYVLSKENKNSYGKF